MGKGEGRRSAGEEETLEKVDKVALLMGVMGSRGRRRRGHGRRRRRGGLDGAHRRIVEGGAA